MEHHHEDSSANNKSLAMLSIGILVVFLVLVFGMYKWVGGKKGGVVFPAGLNYTGGETANQQPATKPTLDFAKMMASAQWKSVESAKKQYKFDYPEGLNPLVFPGDANDSVTFDIADIPVQLNLMATAENISYYDSKLVGRQEEFVNEYWKYFSGLQGVKSVEKFQNEKGLTGFKAVYVTKGGTDTKTNYFFIIPGQNDRVLHVTNIFPLEGESLFLRILNTLEDIK